MKKTITLLMISILTFSLVGCATTNPPKKQAAKAKTSEGSYQKDQIDKCIKRGEDYVKYAKIDKNEIIQDCKQSQTPETLFTL
ncbi:hypothetical protein [Francisella sp. 19X1-34]|uniref:hypothetical protein n=1 Tax=Francisella sp. 19X1-34 TaxID=3087177 RepID=UPI002E2FFFC0|nr:hypothetical protein [Francisella sp. 19X1-34]MED7788393.1 hypothetical protein [Francisella sp. 19X1-34]